VEYIGNEYKIVVRDGFREFGREGSLSGIILL
jgi:hypothetical protein